MKQQPPIFIVGSPRSGTTLLRLILDAHPNISCGPETMFLSELRQILTGVTWEHLALYGFEQIYWQEKIAHFFSSFQEEYAERRGKLRWAEKTPHYTPHLDFILTLFPDSQIIHIIRDGRDVVTSHLNRWGYKAAFQSIKQWREYIRTAKKIGHELPKEQYHEVRYETLVTEPKTTLSSLMHYLQEPWDDSLLNYMMSDHDIQPTYAIHTNKVRERTGQEKALYNARVGAWQTELPLSLKIIFDYRSGVLLKELGYQ